MSINDYLRVNLPSSFQEKSYENPVPQSHMEVCQWIPEQREAVVIGEEQADNGSDLSEEAGMEMFCHHQSKQRRSTVIGPSSCHTCGAKMPVFILDSALGSGYWSENSIVLVWQSRRFSTALSTLTFQFSVWGSRTPTCLLWPVMVGRSSTLMPLAIKNRLLPAL